MIDSRLPFGSSGGGEIHGAIISITFDSIFSQGTCQIIDSNLVVVDSKIISDSLSVNFKGIMKSGTYIVRSILSDGSKHYDKEGTIKDIDILEKNVINLNVNGYEVYLFNSEMTANQFSIMLDHYYNDTFEDGDTLSTYWSVGDVANFEYNGQIIQLQIAGIEHRSLTTPINEKTKCAVALVTKNAIDYHLSANLFGEDYASLLKESYTYYQTQTWTTKRITYEQTVKLKCGEMGYYDVAGATNYIYPLFSTKANRQRYNLDNNVCNYLVQGNYADGAGSSGPIMQYYYIDTTGTLQRYGASAYGTVPKTVPEPKGCCSVAFF